MQVPKLAGADIELGNYISGAASDTPTASAAARMLLQSFPDTVSAHGGRVASAAYGSPYGLGGTAYNPQDIGRRYLKSNGGCVYIDLDHLEMCIPEVLSAYDHVAACHAMLRIVRSAWQRANRELPHGQRIEVLVNNSDGAGHAYGSHLSVLLSRMAFHNLFDRKLHHQLWLAAFQASSIIFTGAGKVGSENGQPSVDFQISQRADFFETLCGVQTTYNRPIINSREEALCGDYATSDISPADLFARLHVIFYDNTLCHGSSLLRIGTLQIVLAMLEAEYIDATLLLDDPVDAVVAWSHDPTLERRMPLMSGRDINAVEMQLLFLERAIRFTADGGCQGVVPRAGEILELWADTLHKLAAKHFEELVPRLDWVLKKYLLDRAVGRAGGLDWLRRKHIDHNYSHLDPEVGLYWAMERAGLIECHVSDESIEALTQEPPSDTRAWTRAHLLRRLDAGAIQSIDWDRLSVRIPDGSYWPATRMVLTDNPLAFGAEESGWAFSASDPAVIVDRLESLRCARDAPLTAPASSH